MSGHKTEKELRTKAAKYLQSKSSEVKCFNERTEQSVPRFAPREIEIGTFLGAGGFCDVREVSGISLDSSAEERAVSQSNESDKIIQDRDFIASHLYRDKCARYAVKKLSSHLYKKPHGTFVSGIIDLAMEVKYLAVIQHPHIIKMRAVSSSHPCSDSFFIVLDRLYETLTERLVAWKKSSKRLRGFGVAVRRLSGGSPKNEKDNLFAERLLVAHDICSALAFLHANHIVYRDIKPDNIGFDVRGDVKIFDFGLAKELSAKYRVTGTNVYKLTKRCGSPRYMASEVFRGLPYNHNVDVYSFGLLLWQVCECKTPFDNFSYDRLADEVMNRHIMPTINSRWSSVLKQIISSSWHRDISKRPECSDICSLLKEEIVGLCGEQILQELDLTSRTDHSLNAKK